MSSLLLNESPLLIMPNLAAKIGLNEAIVLQQIHYWNEINKRSNNNYRDGYYWTFNSYEKWHEQFPFWHVNTIKKIISSLETKNLTITGNYNRSQIDRTKWYRVNYEMLDSMESAPEGVGSNPIVQNQYDAKDNIRILQRTDIVRPIPETTSKTNSETSKKNKYSFVDEMSISPLFGNKDVVRAIHTYITQLYKKKTKKDHPILKPEQYRSVYDNICSYADEFNCADYKSITDIMCYFLNSKTIKSDWNINHFATEGIIINSLYKTCY